MLLTAAIALTTALSVASSVPRPPAPGHPSPCSHRGVACAVTGIQDLGIPLGETAPGGPLETLDGKPVDLSTYLGKQPVVLEFWATWCGNCKQLEPAMRKAMATHGKQVRFVTIAVSINQSVERVKAWQAQHPLPGDLLYDRKGVVSGAYDAPATSYVVVINRQGKVVYTGVGGTQNLDAAIRKAL